MNEKKIKEAFNSVDIKSTSGDILEATPSTKEHKKRVNPLFIIVPSISVLSLASILTIILVNPSSNNSNPELVTTISEKGDQAAFEIYTALSFIDNDSPILKTNKRVLNRGGSITQTTFEDIVNVYHDNYKTYAGLLDNGLAIESTIESGEYVIEGTTYTNKMTIENSYSLYYSFNFSKLDDDEIENIYSAVIEDKDKYYPVRMEVEKNERTNNKEIEMLITLDSLNKIEVEYATKVNKKSYEFTKIYRGEEVESIELEIKENNGKKKLELEIEKNDKEFSYIIHKEQTKEYFISYEHESDEDEYEGTMKAINNSDNTISYIDQKTQITVIKK